MTDIAALRARNAEPIVQLSTRGMIEIMSHEGICLEPYLDSVGSGPSVSGENQIG